MGDVKQVGLLAVAALILATPALADPQPPAAASDAPVAQPSAAAVQSDDTDAQIAAFTNAPVQGQPQDVGPAPPRQIHGEAGVGFGSRGYREGYVYADVPIGRASDLGIGVDDTQFKTPYGRNVNSKSLSLSLTLDARDLGGKRGGCRAAAMPMDGRYLEPMWVAEAHGEALARDQADCEAAQAASTSAANTPPPPTTPMRAAE